MVAPARKGAMMLHMTYQDELQARSNVMALAIHDCLLAHRACIECSIHCIARGGRHAARDHQTLLNDCAEICQTAANFMTRGSPRHADVCGVCAEACEACSDECGRMGPDDTHMMRCAELCRICATTCRDVAEHVRGEPPAF